MRVQVKPTRSGLGKVWEHACSLQHIPLSIAHRTLHLYLINEGSCVLRLEKEDHMIYFSHGILRDCNVERATVFDYKILVGAK